MIPSLYAGPLLYLAPVSCHHLSAALPHGARLTHRTARYSRIVFVRTWIYLLKTLCNSTAVYLTWSKLKHVLTLSILMWKIW
jgi:hypothetical protein